MPKLKRVINLWELTLAGIGIILGAGIYVIIGQASGLAGNGLWLAFILAALTALFTGLTYAELSSRYPQSGSVYIYLTKAFNNKLLSYLISWFMIFGGIIAASTVALGFAGYLSAFTGLNTVLIGMTLILMCGVILIYGVKESAWFAIICSLIEVGGLILIIIMGIPFIGSIDYLDIPSIGGIIGAASLVFFAFIGFEDMVNMAEEVKNPIKNMPKALLLSISISTVLYVLVAISAVSVVGWETLSQSDAPLALVAQTAFGDLSYTVLGYIALFATANTVLLVLMGISRLVYGMAVKKILPGFLGLIHKTRRTPWASILILVILSMLFVYFGKEIKTVAGLTNASILIVFTMVNLSIIHIRYKERNKKIKGKHFKIPLNIGWLPILPVFGLVTCILLFVNIETIYILYALASLIPAVIVYLFIK